jgi:hypothetical protein
MQKMKVLVFMALTWCCMSAGNQAIAQGVAAFTLQLDVASQKNQVGDDETVTLKMTNISDHDIEYAVGGPEPFYRLLVRDIHDKAAKETAYGMKVHGTDPNRRRFFGSIFAALLKKGETVTDKIDLGKEYDLSTPGVYRVSASRIDPETHNVVKSNEIQITVLPK